MSKKTKAERGITGSFRWYFRWPLLLSVLLICMNVAIYLIDTQSGIVMSFFVLVYVGIAIANLINILDPQKIVLGGILIQRYPRYFDIVKDVANSHKVKGARENDMEISSLGENAGVIGAGEVVADHFFSEAVNEVFVKNG